MASSRILLGNVYVMLAYAFNAPHQIERATSGTVSFNHLHDLFAHIIAEETAKQVKRGLDHNYFERNEEIPTVRGRIDLARTIAQRSLVRGRLVCEFEEYLPDTPINRAVKAVVGVLMGHGDVDKQRRKALVRLLPYFEDVADVPPQSVRWRELSITRANASYRFLLACCELAAAALLPGEGQGDTLVERLGEDRMNDLFEGFVREYFRVHHRQMRAGKRQIRWDVEGVVPAQLPRMECDVLLQDGTRTLIVDTKYYSGSMQHQAGTNKLISDHLYQLSAYVRNYQAYAPGPVSGLIVYAKTDEAVVPSMDTLIGGQRIGAATLDLSAPWPQLRREVEAIRSRF